MKEKRDRLFKRGRPNVRNIIVDENGRVHKDIGIIWVAYKKGSFLFLREGMNEQEFFLEIKRLSEESSLYMIDDSNKEYNGIGPIAIVNIDTDGWKIEPHAIIFPWASNRNKIKAVVAFFQMVRYQKIGCCVVYSLAESKPLFDKAQEYGVLNYVGKIPNGDPRGDEYLYTIRGKRK
jgi:hypothetical protein